MKTFLLKLKWWYNTWCIIFIKKKILLFFLAPPLTVALLFTRHIIRPVSTVCHTGLWPQSDSGKQKMANHRRASAAPLNHKMTQHGSRSQLSTDNRHRPAPLLLLQGVLMCVVQAWWLLLTRVAQSILSHPRLVQTSPVDPKLFPSDLLEDTGCRPVCLLVCKLRTDLEWL